MSKKLWFLSEVYYPDEQGTAFYMTGLAEAMAQDFDVSVLCSYPTVTAKGARVEKREMRNGVRIERCRGAVFNKDIFSLRILNVLANSLSIFLKTLVRLRRGDIVFVVTSPPSLPFIGKLACLLRGAKCVLKVDDVYPEVMIAAGMISGHGVLARFLGFLNRLLYRSIDQIVVLGRDMKALAEKKDRPGRDRIRIINNWADTDIVRPRPKSENTLLRELHIQNKFVVACAGNMGRAQAIEQMFGAVTELSSNSGIHFLFIGSGAKREWMERQVREQGLKNVSLIGQRPREDQINFLNACDVSMISLLSGMTGAGVPSRLYNLMAAGKPVIAVADADSEVALVVKEEGIGWVAPPTNGPGEIVRAILEAQSSPAQLKEMGERAYAAAKEKYAREKIITRYFGMLLEMAGMGTEGLADHDGKRRSLTPVVRSRLHSTKDCETLTAAERSK